MMDKKVALKKSAKIAGLVLLLFVLTVFFIFPFYAMLSRSLMSDVEIRTTVRLFPLNISFQSYLDVFSNAKIAFWLLNTLIIAVINIIGTTFSSSLCAYGFSKLQFPGRDLCFSLVLATLMLPSIVMQIPLYVIFSDLQWIGTWLPLIVPGFFGGGAVNIFLMRQFMRGIPNQLAEAASIDGAGSFRIYIQLVMPLCLPIAIYIVVNTFLGCWNDFMNPLLYLANYESKYNLSLGLYMEFNNVSNAYLANDIMAAGVMMLLPCLAIFFVFQRYLIEGVTMTGLKG